MPLVKIDLIRGVWNRQEIEKIAQTIQDVMLEKFAAPHRDRYQIITQHEPYEIICEDTGLGIERSEKIVFIQIFQQGRTQEQKTSVYAALAEDLEKNCGVKGSDLIISIAANTKDDWSFGMGRAQFLTGELPISK